MKTMFRGSALAVALTMLAGSALAQVSGTPATLSTQIGPTNEAAAANPSATKGLNGVLKGFWTDLKSLFGSAGAPSTVVLTVQGASAGTPVPVAVSSSALPAGASTAAAQATGNTSLVTIATNTTGVATAANQATANASLATIAANTAAVDNRTGASAITAADSSSTTISGQSGVSLITGTPSANSYVSWALTGQSAGSLTVTGTFVQTAAIETSSDGGSTFAPATAKILGTGATTGSVTAPGVFRVDLAGMTNVRLRATSYTSGTLSAKLTTSNSAGLTQIINPVRLLGSDGLTAAGSGNPVPTAATYGASGVAPVTQAFTTTGQTAAFTPVAGRPFNVSGWGTFVAGYQLERSFDSGTTWLPLTVAGTQTFVWTAAASEIAQDTEVGVQYRVRVTSYTSGTLNVRISQ